MAKKLAQFSESAVKAELQMTSMIDVVFLLLIFFVMTFKISIQEGDFNVRMPLSSPNAGPMDENTEIPLKLRLIADSNGEIADIVLNDSRSFGKDFNAVNVAILDLVGTSEGPKDADSGPEVEIDLDFELRYEYVIEAITAVTGQRRGDNVIRLVDKIKFAPPRPPRG